MLQNHIVKRVIMPNHASILAENFIFNLWKIHNFKLLLIWLISKSPQNYIWTIFWLFLSLFFYLSYLYVQYKYLDFFALVTSMSMAYFHAFIVCFIAANM